MKLPRCVVVPATSLSILLGAGCTQLEFKPTPNSRALIAAQETIYNVSDLTIPPHTVRYTPVKVPSTLKSSAGSAKVVLGVIVLPEGNVVVENVIEKTEGPMAYAAIKAVEQWKFSPGILHGRKVATRMEIPFTYNTSTRDLDIDRQSFNNTFHPVPQHDHTPDINVFEGQFQKD